VALRRLDEGTCEMKRLYVDDAGRGAGVGRALAEAVVQRARDLGHTTMLLDTSVEQHEAIALYRSLGFEETEAVHDVPDDMREWLVFFRLDL
jgi:ribosomal protein S18 acetylase RimI-like enzyme